MRRSHRILVTGGSGFLGSHIADALSEAGHCVSIFDIKESPYLRHDQQMIVGDLLDAKSLREAMAGCDFVYHMGAIADIDVAIHNPQKTIEVNILGTVNLLEAARDHGVQRVLFASSIYVYSRTGSFYRISKHAGELLLEEYKERFGLDFTILRFGTLYGTRSDTHNSVYRYLLSALRERRIEFKGLGSETREYIHVDDAARICVEAMGTQYSGESLILTGNHRVKVLELLAMIREILGNDVEIVHNHKESVSHYVETPYSYQPRVGKKIISTTYCDLGQSLLKILEEIDSPAPQPLAV